MYLSLPPPPLLSPHVLRAEQQEAISESLDNAVDLAAYDSGRHSNLILFGTNSLSLGLGSQGTDRLFNGATGGVATQSFPV